MDEKLIAVIPAYNEEQHIKDVINKTKKYVNKIIVIDDGSTDKTYEKSKKADLVLKHIINMGKGLALKTGIEAAINRKADLIVTLDADGQHKPEDIPRLVKILKEDNLDIVVGGREFDENMPLVMKVGNMIIQKIFRVLFKVNIKDTQSGLRLFKAEIYPKIKWSASSYAVETEMLVKVGRYKLSYKEIPIETLYQDKYKGTTIFDGIKIILSMIFWRIRE